MDENELEKFTRHKVNVIHGDILNNLDSINEDLNEGKRFLSCVILFQEHKKFLKSCL